MQASRLLALSILVRERGDDHAADEFMRLAVETTERNERPVLQQQQQVQPKKEE
jgi:histidinol-phosphate/aromatic aminotransferase/cobyric acid decarboxylase-like protein